MKRQTSRFAFYKKHNKFLPAPGSFSLDRACASYMQNTGRIPETIQDAIRLYPEAEAVLWNSGEAGIPLKNNGSIQDICWLSAIRYYLKHLESSDPSIIQGSIQRFMLSFPRIWSQTAIGNPINPESILPKELISLISQNWGFIVTLAVEFEQRELLRKELLVQQSRGQNTAEQVKELRKQNKALEERFAASHRRAETADRKLRQLQLANSSQRESNTDGVIDSLQQSIRTQRHEIGELQSALESAEKELAEKEHRIYLLESSQLGQEPKPWMDGELPETGVVFAGGNPNCIKKWKNRYPKWCFISSENPSASLPSKVNVVFLCFNHTISHTLYESIKQSIPDRQKYCYLSSTNLDLLDEEMRFEYWKMQNS